MEISMSNQWKYLDEDIPNLFTCELFEKLGHGLLGQSDQPRTPLLTPQDTFIFLYSNIHFELEMRSLPLW